jgi:hypothetical protein
MIAGNAKDNRPCPMSEVTKIIHAIEAGVPQAVQLPPPPFCGEASPNRLSSGSWSFR